MIRGRIAEDPEKGRGRIPGQTRFGHACGKRERSPEERREDQGTAKEQKGPGTVTARGDVKL
jgi:hypothetical protein